MAISDIPEYAHLTDADVEALGAEFDAIRRDIEADRGERTPSTSGTRSDSSAPSSCPAGPCCSARATESCGLSVPALRCLQDRREHGARAQRHARAVGLDERSRGALHHWEWDNAGPSAHWKHTHNYIHHKYTNVLGMDDDVGYGLLRVTRDQRWKPFNLGNVPLQHVAHAALRVRRRHPASRAGSRRRRRASNRRPSRRTLKEVGSKVGRRSQDYVVTRPWPAGRPFLECLATGPDRDLHGNAIRNMWTNAMIFCGHFPDGAEKFTKRDVDNETQAQWYLRQMLGSANFHAARRWIS